MAAPKKPDLEAVVKLALAPASDGRSLNVKLRSLITLVEITLSGKRAPLSRYQLRRELRSVVGTDLIGGRAAEASFRALGVLERLDAPRSRRQGRPLDPTQQAPDDYWHPDPSMRELDQHDTVQLRDQWRARLEQFRPDTRR